MKHLSKILFAFALALPLAACGDDDPNETPADAMVTPPAIDADTTPTPIAVDEGIAGTLMDRTGRPGISTVLLGCGVCGTADVATRDANKTSFSTKTVLEAAADTTLTDEQNLAIDGLTGLGNNGGTLVVNGVSLDAATLKAVLVSSDVLKIDPSKAGATYLGVDVGADSFGGRPLDQDIVDVSLTALTRSAITTDTVDKGDRTFNTTFPYLGAPWPAP